MSKAIPVIYKSEVLGSLEVEDLHFKTFRVFSWHGRPPFVDGCRAHIVFSDAERDLRTRTGLGTTRTYSFSPGRLAWMLKYDQQRVETLLLYYQLTGHATLLANELKRPFRILFRTSNKLNVTMKNIRCPAVEKALPLDPRLVALVEKHKKAKLYDSPLEEPDAH